MMLKLKYLVLIVALAVSFTGVHVESAFAQVRGAKVRKPNAAKRTAKSRATEVLQAAEGDGDTDRASQGGRAERRSGNSVRVVKISAAGQVPTFGKPGLGKMQRAAKSFDGDLRQLSTEAQEDFFRPEREYTPTPLTLGGAKSPLSTSRASQPSGVDLVNAPAPSAITQFDGLTKANIGNGWPPDTNGDVGPNHYIQTINTGIGIFDKNTGAYLVGPISFNTFMSQGAFGNLCDTNNFGDPVVLYDSFEDRWVITDFAFTLSGGAVNSPTFQCIAVSKTGDPVSGGWYFYSISTPETLADYPKYGVWPDGIYLTGNMFGKGANSGSFVFSREWAFNKQQMYAGAANPQIVTFEAPKLDSVGGGQVFTIIPSNARVQTGTPPAGTPNYFVGTGSYSNAVAVWKFHVDWTNVYNSTFSLGNLVLQPSSWIGAPGTVTAPGGGNNLDTLAGRTMMQTQYTNIGGVESLWNTHTVRNSTTTGIAVPRWYQVDVTGGTIAASTVQAANYEPDATSSRWMPSLAVDRQGNMLLGFNSANGATNPKITWAGRLAGDSANTLGQTDTDVIAGGGHQTGNLSGSPVTRWGDYSAMSLDPADGCTFWFTTEYYNTNDLNYLTRIASTKYPGCSSLTAGSVTGTVTSSGSPVSGATVNFGARTATTAADGTYTFNNVPAGTYPSISASAAGKVTSTNATVVVPSGSSSTQNFSLAAAPSSGTLTDTSQADFSLGTPSNVDLTTSAGSVSLSRTSLDQYNLSSGGVGFGFTATSWSGMTFTPSVSGQLTRLDVSLFCSNANSCTGTPAITVSIRATAAGLPTGPDLATASIGGFSTNSSILYTANFASPATLVAGTQYAFIVRPVSNPSAGTYDFTVSGNGSTAEDTYAGGTRVSSTDSGATWASTTGRDSVFRTYMTAPSGTLVSRALDANPAAGQSTSWTSLNWVATTGAGQTLQFQAAASNSPNGPFNFVGPDGTAGTFFTTSGSSLGQFNGKRYLKYKAYLASTLPASSPAIDSVSVAFQNNAPTAATVAVSGRVLGSDGGGVRNAVVTMTSPTGIVRSAMTNAYGYYSFDSVQSGANYVMRATAKRYSFSPRTVIVTDSLSDVDFVDGQ